MQQQIFKDSCNWQGLISELAKTDTEAGCVQVHLAPAGTDALFVMWATGNYKVSATVLKAMISSSVGLGPGGNESYDT